MKEIFGKFTLFASDYLALDSNVLTGGGTDQTAELQALLDKALEWGSLYLVLDGAVLTSGVKIHSNTTVFCPNQACGMYLKDHSNRHLLENAHVDWHTIRDENIAFIGGSYNINCEHQQRTDGAEEYTGDDPDKGDEAWERFLHLTFGFVFVGVRSFTMQGLRLIDQRIYGMTFGNWEHMVLEDVAVELPHNYYAQNQDGIHFFGPGRDLVIRNFRGCAGDDVIALAPDELDGVSSITDVTIDGVYMENADQGIRLLSRKCGRLDRVYIRNVYGTYKSCGFFINPWWGKGCGDCEGNYGAISFENIDLRPTYHKYADYATPFLFRLGGRIESMSLKNIRVTDSADARPLVEVTGTYGHWTRTGSMVDIGCLTIDGVEVINRHGTTDPTKYIDINGKVDNLFIRNVQIARKENPAEDTVISFGENAQVGRMVLTDVYADGVKEILADLNGKVAELICK